MSGSPLYTNEEYDQDQDLNPAPGYEDDYEDQDDDPEQDASPPRALERSGKRPYSLTQLFVDDEAQEEVHEEELEPDLHAYFLSFPHLGKANVIAICRSYANAVSATIPKAPRGPYRPRKTTRSHE